MDALFKHRLFIRGRKNVALPVFAWQYRRVLLATVYQPPVKLDYFSLVLQGGFLSFLPIYS